MDESVKEPQQIITEKTREIDRLIAKVISH
jgi:hypothetical protein